MTSFTETSFTGPDVSFTTGAASTPDTVGMAGGKRKKQVGHQLIHDDLGPRPVRHISGESVGKTVLRPLNKSKSKLAILFKTESRWNPVPMSALGHSIAKDIRS